MGSLDVLTSGLNSIVRSDTGIAPQAIIIGALDEQAALFINASLEQWPQHPPTFLVTSISDIDLLVSLLGSNAQNASIFHASVTDRTAFTAVGYAAEAEIVGKLAIAILEHVVSIRGNLTRENFLVSAYNPGTYWLTNSIRAGPLSDSAVVGYCNQALHTVYISQYGLSAITPISVPFCGSQLHTMVTSTGAAERIIHLGQSIPLTGPNEFMGQQVQLGVLAALRSINDHGGIHGIHLELRSYDDGYDPVRATNNTFEMLQHEHPLVVLCPVGTPTVLAMVAAIQSQSFSRSTPIISPITGALSLRLPYSQSNIINLRASYHSEVYAMLKMATARGLSRVSCFYQNDSFGLTGLDAVKTATTSLNLPVLSQGTYERNTLDYEPGLQTMLSVNIAPEVVVMIGVHLVLAMFVSKAKLVCFYICQIHRSALLVCQY